MTTLSGDAFCQTSWKASPETVEEVAGAKIETGEDWTADPCHRLNLG